MHFKRTATVDDGNCSERENILHLKASVDILKKVMEQKRREYGEMRKLNDERRQKIAKKVKI